MGERKAIDNQAVTLMLLLSSVWGMQQVALKAAAPDMAPILQIALRSLIAALAVTAFIVIKRQRWHLEHWRPGILAGLFFSVEYFLIGESLAFTSASHVTVFLYSAPVFVAL
ncbi:MAG: EamA family transporter, partial [Pseudomonadales bacterium]